MAKIGIIGGGPAGLGLAYRLGQRGHEVRLFERSPELGGLARSFELGGVRVERYYHFLFGDDAPYLRYLAELGLEGRLRWATTRMGFFHDGVLHPFTSGLDLLRCPALPWAGRLRYAALALRCGWTRDWRSLDHVSARDWLTRHVGRRTYEVTWRPLLEEKFHHHHGRVSAAWIWHRIHKVARGRSRSLRPRLGCVTGGTDVLLDALAAACQRQGATLARAAPVRRVLHDGGRCLGAESGDGVRHALDAVISTAPLPEFLRLVPDLPAAYRARLERIAFVGVACATFRLRRSLTPNFWLNVSDTRVPFNGCIEFTRLNPAMTPDGSHVVYVPHYLPHDGERYGRPDGEILEETLAGLRAIDPALSERDVLAAAVSRDPHAQPVCEVGFASAVPPHETPVEGLYLLEASQLYPADRSIGGALGLADGLARRVDADLAAGRR